MKKITLLILFLSVILSAKAQVTSKSENTKSLKDIDSVILKKSSSILNAEMNSLKSATRGIANTSSCDGVLDDLRDAFSALKQIHINCCKGETSLIAGGVVLYKIYKIYNSGCDWDQNPSLYAAALYYRLEYDKWEEKYYCGEDCKNF